MRGLLANHVHTELISDNLLQEARDWAKCGEGNTPLTCLWMYNILVKCNLIGSIRFLKNKDLGLMKPAHAAYLESLQDNQQFPGARCNKLHDNMPDVYMYGLTSSSGVESMN